MGELAGRLSEGLLPSSGALTPLWGPLAPPPPAARPEVSDKLDEGPAPELFVTLSCKSSRVGILQPFAVSRCRTSPLYLARGVQLGCGGKINIT